jgi:K+-sensing histidine kinase KdpD
VPAWPRLWPRRSKSHGGTPPRREAIYLAKFFQKLTFSPSFNALSHGTRLIIAPVADDIAVYAEPDMLAAALDTLLQNAFQFTKDHTEARLSARLTDDWVMIDIEDRCGGLPAGAGETMFLPSAQRGDSRSGTALGLDSCASMLSLCKGLRPSPLSQYRKKEQLISGIQSICCARHSAEPSPVSERCAIR